jgi:Protein of unknown function (DUF3999)
LLAHLLLLTALASAPVRLPDRWDHWKYVRSIEGGGRSGTLSVAVPPSIYANAEPSLDDLRVVSVDGTLVPFLIEIPEAANPVTWRDAVLTDTGFVAGRYAQAVADLGPERGTYQTLDIATPRAGFVATVDVDASDDGVTWRTIRSGAPIFDYRRDGLATNTSVTFPASTARYLRVRVAGAGNFPIAGIRVARLEGTTAPNTRYALALGTPERNAAAKTTTVRIDGVDAVPLDRLRVDSDTPRFSRRVELESSTDGNTWQTVAGGEIARSLPGHDSLWLDFAETQAPRWRLVVHDGDDAPLRALRANAFGRPRRIDFDAAAGTQYLLLYGRPDAEAAHFDYGQTHDAAALARAGRAAVGAPFQNAAYVSAQPVAPWSERNRWVLWAALALAVAGIGGVAIRTMSAPPPPA